jgi:hypothetical protein
LMPVAPFSKAIFWKQRHSCYGMCTFRNLLPFLWVSRGLEVHRTIILKWCSETEYKGVNKIVFTVICFYNSFCTFIRLFCLSFI